MRIAIITDNFLPKLDGVTRILDAMLKELQVAGHQVLVIGPDNGIKQFAEAEIIGTTGIPYPFYPELKFNFFRPLFVHRLKAFCPDIIHIVDPTILGGAGVIAARFLHKPLISSYHTNLAQYCSYFGFSLFAEPIWLYKRFIHNQSLLTFCPSPSTASKLITRGFQNLRIWSGGVDITLFHPNRRNEAVRSSWLKNREHPDNKVVLLYVGRISWEKNLRLLVQAFKEMNYQHCHLVIVGDGPAYSDIQQQLSNLPVTFTGYLRDEAFRSEGICELVSDGYTGLLDVQWPNIDQQVISYKEKLKWLINNPISRRVMGQNARTKSQEFLWPRVMNRLLHGYEEAIELGESVSLKQKNTIELLENTGEVSGS